MFFRKHNNIGLLPYIVEEFYGLTPNDPQIKGWEILKLEVDKQWEKSTGEGVTVGVIDTGCDRNHPDIESNIIGGFNFLTNSKDFMDDNGHGSHVCGTICATNNSRGMVGVAPNTKIHALKVMDAKGQGDPNAITKAIYYCIDNNIDIITMSLGSKNHIPILKQAIQKAYDSNILMFCAAGNSGLNHDIMYPAKDKNTISIGAVNDRLERTNFTCSGDSLDFLAPGENIMSILPNNRYGLMSGTSMSNPFAVGCASLYLSYYRKYKGKHVIKQEEMIEILKQNSIKLQNKQFQDKKYQGYGVIKPVL
jgi:major intracellular serine protease